MAVLVEGISVVVRRASIKSKFQGGWALFVALVPNETMCTDEIIVRVGFLSPQDTQNYIELLESRGLTFLVDGHCQDLAVVDQLRGPTMPADWLEYARLPWGDTGAKVAACWLFDGPRMGAGTHFPSRQIAIATPRGWQYEDSLSSNFTFVPGA